MNLYFLEKKIIDNDYFYLITKTLYCKVYHAVFMIYQKKYHALMWKIEYELIMILNKQIS